MAITRVKVETELARRLGKRLTAAELDATASGSNTNLNGGICKGLQSLGITASDPTAVTDADLAAVTASSWAQLLDVAELRVMEDILGNLPVADTWAGPVKQSLSQLADQLEKAIERKQKQVSKDYGIGASTIYAGVVSLDISEHGDGTSTILGSEDD